MGFMPSSFCNCGRIKVIVMTVVTLRVLVVTTVRMKAASREHHLMRRSIVVLVASLHTQTWTVIAMGTMMTGISIVKTWMLALSAPSRTTPCTDEEESDKTDKRIIYSDETVQKARSLTKKFMKQSTSLLMSSISTTTKTWS